MKINSINQSIKKAIIKPLNNTSIWNADNNDLPSQYNKILGEHIMTETIKITKKEIKERDDLAIYKEFYLVSNLGKIYYPSVQKIDDISEDKEIEFILKSYKFNNYYTTMIKQNRMLVHRIIAEIFCSGKDEIDDKGDIRNTVDHIYRDKKNNNATGLEWVSQAENNRRFNAYKIKSA